MQYENRETLAIPYSYFAQRLRLPVNFVDVRFMGLWERRFSK
jgi:hypothetical protein